jgi:hypothetical protein
VCSTHNTEFKSSVSRFIGRTGFKPRRTAISNQGARSRKGGVGKSPSRLFWVSRRTHTVFLSLSLCRTPAPRTYLLRQPARMSPVPTGLSSRYSSLFHYSCRMMGTDENAVKHLDKELKPLRHGDCALQLGLLVILRGRLTLKHGKRRSTEHRGIPTHTQRQRNVERFIVRPAWQKKSCKKRERVGQGVVGDERHVVDAHSRRHCSVQAHAAALGQLRR